MSSGQDVHVVRRGKTWSVMKEGSKRGLLHGIGGLFSFVDVLNRRLLVSSAAEADAEALRLAWEEVGGYLYDAIGAYSSETGVYVDGKDSEWTRKKANNENSSS